MSKDKTEVKLVSENCVNSTHPAYWLHKGVDYCQCSFECKVRVQIEKNGHPPYTYVVSQEEYAKLTNASTEVKEQGTADPEQILKTAIESYNSQVADFFKLKISDNELKIFSGCMTYYSSLTNSLLLKEIERLSLDFGLLEIELSQKKILLISCETALSDRDKQIEELKAVLSELSPLLDNIIHRLPTGDNRNSVCELNIKVKSIFNPLTPIQWITKQNPNGIK